jgi:3-hydroxyacyl-[acyl-carrier-protein] dehydratase
LTTHEQVAAMEEYDPFDRSLLPLENDFLRMMLPHRWPFLMIDRVVDLHPPDSAVGIKCVSSGEPYFAGHFPERAVMPGALQIEALAQLAGVLLGVIWAREPDDSPPRLGFLIGVSNWRFKRPVRPGDQLELRVKAKARVQSAAEFEGEARVGRDVVCKGTFQIAIESFKDKVGGAR